MGSIGPGETFFFGSTDQLHGPCEASMASIYPFLKDPNFDGNKRLQLPTKDKHLTSKHL